MATSMFRFLSRKAFNKAVPRPASRWIHSIRPPYAGPPSYDMVTRRFSVSEVDPQAYYTSKGQQEGIERGEFVEIQDISNYLEDYDVLIPDIKHETLETEIAEIMGIPYLMKATEAEAEEAVKVGIGYMHGMNKRSMVPFIVRHGKESRWVFFMVDNTAPLTYLSIQASKLLNIDEATSGVTIGGHHHVVYPSPASSGFQDVNILGTDFCQLHRLFKVEDYTKRRIKLHFGGEWKLMEKPEL